MNSIPSYLRLISINKKRSQLKIHIITSIIYLFIIIALLQLEWSIINFIVFIPIILIHIAFLLINKLLIEVYIDQENKIFIYDDQKKLLDHLHLHQITYIKSTSIFGGYTNLIFYNNHLNQKKAFILKFNFYARIEGFFKNIELSNPNILISKYSFGIDDILELIRIRKQLITNY